MTTDQKTFDVQNVINAGFTLEPLRCRYCKATENVVFNQGVGDAYCENCGTWQLDCPVDEEKAEAPKEARPKPKNNLISIGFLSGFSCYLNISLEEAKERYAIANQMTLKEVEDYTIQEWEFDDEFEAYDITKTDRSGK